MKAQSVILIAATLFLAGSVYPFSHDGHYLVGAIADQMLAGTPTGAKVKQLIGKVSLAAAATMPDEIKDWDPSGRKHNLPFKVTTNKKLNADLEAFLHANQTRPDCTKELLHHEYHFTDIQVFDPPSYSEGQVGTSDHDIVCAYDLLLYRRFDRHKERKQSPKNYQTGGACAVGPLRG